ncbi:MAG: 3-phosphoshikimate 1-carboxyvinyltransferase [Planctomyces sp.]|nr:3-phosphoshikimate 1-carboxyvinyltransferase [Planctomyces sp.]
MSRECEEREITPVLGPVRGTIRPPGSKSLTNRALVIAALARGRSVLTGVLASRDTEVMLDSLRRLGIAASHDPASKTMTVEGAGGPAKCDAADLWLENSGTSIRFLAALCSLGQGTFRLDGNGRMRERPIGPLADALRQAGAEIRYEMADGCPPIVVSARRWTTPELAVAGDLSSQYLSGLMMAAPAAACDVTIRVTGTLVSRPYVDMTLAIMRAFGAEIGEPQSNTFRIRGTGYQAREYAIEPDASAASYFFGAAAVTGGRVTVEGLHRHALQGDVAFVDALEQMGCAVDWGESSITVGGPDRLRGIDIDMNAISDTAQTLACVAPFAEGPTRIRNVGHMRHKETDRVAAVVAELRRLGVWADEHEDGLTVHPGPPGPGVVRTYDDHRMAMSFALIGLRTPGIRIADPGCTAKTYPDFFDDLDSLCAADRRSSS